MGVFRRTWPCSWLARRLPHARGGVSGSLEVQCATERSSPRPWGCFQPQHAGQHLRRVFPTPVGVFRTRSLPILPRSCLPHARGGVSFVELDYDQYPTSSPRPWGCFRAMAQAYRSVRVFPTPVGVFLYFITRQPAQSSLPHARGGVSVLRFKSLGRCKSSPRPWGCFHKRHAEPFRTLVFPTPVGVFPVRQTPGWLNFRLPHARGGVSQAALNWSASLTSSPRPWGCFWKRPHRESSPAVFPTPVGVFPWFLALFTGLSSLPHARGGVSPGARRWYGSAGSSPRPWGCFTLVKHKLGAWAVFPTPVGVCPTAYTTQRQAEGLPHARGGVSSPRPWGCFCYRDQDLEPAIVFPTPVGVFPRRRVRRRMQTSLPHARGGVSADG